MKKLDVLYMCDDGFAEIAGVSITSLFEKNPKDIIQITVYLLGVQISEENKIRFHTLEEQFGQKIVLIDAQEEYNNIQNMKLAAYRGSAMTNLRLHFDKLIPDTVHRIVYIDCDTIICDTLLELCDFPLNGKLLAMTLDAYGRMLCDKQKNSDYYNAGILLIDCDKWRCGKWREQIECFIENNTEKLSHPDQDVFNIVCKDEIVRLPIRYNLQVVHREYSEKLYFKCLAPERYYSQKEIEQARKNPAILHMIRVLGTNPWYEDGKLHPDFQIYQKYKLSSLWKNEEPKKSHQGIAIKCERILKNILPKCLFFPISLAAIAAAMKSDENNKY